MDITKVLSRTVLHPKFSIQITGYLKLLRLADGSRVPEDKMVCVSKHKTLVNNSNSKAMVKPALKKSDSN